MIKVNVFKDGVYVFGHDRNEVCTLISYAMYSAINDCLRLTDEIEYYQSTNDENHSRLGLTYFKILKDADETCYTILNNFKINTSEWITYLFPEVQFEVFDMEIKWDVALKSANDYISGLNKGELK